MRALAAVLALGICLTAAPPVVAGDDVTPNVTTPPPRPLPITATQNRVLQDLSRRPEHAVASRARASYSPEVA
ncbi:MAG: hypothetical protein ACYSUI_04960, partial [Planctomycetota bacterium]